RRHPHLPDGLAVLDLQAGGLLESASVRPELSTGEAMSGIRQVGYFDCPGGGQVVVSGTTAYIAHMKAPHGTTIVDVSDPARPRQLAQLTIPPEVHSHKVRVVNGVMLVNREAAPRTQLPAGARAGLGIYDVTSP